MAKKKLALAGDSICQAWPTTNENQGWGYFLPNYFDLNQLTIDNRAISGRSTNTFNSGGDWAALKATNPDFCMINFGTNDEATAVSVPTYTTNITAWINELRAQNCVPILITSSPWLYEDGTIPNTIRHPNTLLPYTQAKRDLGISMACAVVDLYDMLRQKYNSIGWARAYKDWSYPTAGNVTHPNPDGANLMASFIANGLRGRVPGLHKLRRPRPMGHSVVR